MPQFTFANINMDLQVWIKPNGEMPFLYGNHVVKAHLGRITEDTPEHQGVIVFSMSDVPLVSTHVRNSLFLNFTYAAGLWRYGSIHRRYQEIGSYCHHCVPSSVIMTFFYCRPYVTHAHNAEMSENIYEMRRLYSRLAVTTFTCV